MGLGLVGKGSQLPPLFTLTLVAARTAGSEDHFCSFESVHSGAELARDAETASVTAHNFIFRTNKFDINIHYWKFNYTTLFTSHLP